MNKARIVVFSDLQSHPWQEGERTDREYDCARVLEFVNEYSQKQKPDAIVFGGDFFEAKRNIRSDIVSTTYEAAVKLSALGIPVIFMAGNHDYYKNRCTLTPLASVANFSVLDRHSDAELCRETINDLNLSFFPNGADYNALLTENGEYDVAFVHDDIKGAKLNAHIHAARTCLPEELFESYGEDSRAVIIGGHYHSPQTLYPFGRKGKVPVEICGAPISHNWSDVDENTPRGLMLLTLRFKPPKLSYEIERITLDAHFPKFVSTESQKTKDSDFVLVPKVKTSSKQTVQRKAAASVVSTSRKDAFIAYVVAAKGKQWCLDNRDEFKALVRKGLDLASAQKET